MKKRYIFFIVLLIGTLTFSGLSALQNDYFSKGKMFYDKKDFEKSKFYFEKDIVFNPRNEKSYLYLAKIFEKNENEIEEEKNLDSVLLLNPKNDEAIYMLTLLKIKQSDYNEAKELIKKFQLVCNLFCNKKNEIKKKLNKIIPENEKDKN